MAETPARPRRGTDRQVLLQLWRAVVRFRHRLAAAIVFLVAAKLATVGVPLVLKRIIDALGRPEEVVALPLFLLVGYALLRFAGTLFGELRDRVFAPAALHTVADFSRRAFLRLLQLNPRQLPGRNTGALTRDVERGTAGLAFLLGIGLFTVVPTLVEIVAVMAIMLRNYSGWFAVVLVATFLMYTVHTVEFTQRREVHQRALNELDSRANSYLVDRMFNYDTVKTHAHEALEDHRFRTIMRDMVATGVRNQTALSTLHIGQSGIIAVGVGAVMVMAGREVVGGTMTVGDLVLINAFVIQVCLPLNALGFVFRQVRDAMVNVEKLFDILEVEPELADAPDAAELVLRGGRVDFRHVEFGYEPGRRDLADIDFSIPAGGTVAVVGASGSGKSTVTRLLLRLYDVHGGSIEIDGQDVRSVTQRSLRAAIGLVPQDAGLFNESIAYNIRYGKPDATMEEVHAAARAARIHDFVVSLPAGYDTVVGERGLKLSGGEKQRIAIARALVKDPPILILDEATSALDPIAERGIQASLEQAARGRTTLIIAHRMATVVHANLVLVVERGRIVERGTHQALLGAGGLYARMWALQQQQRELAHEVRRLARQPINLGIVAATAIDAMRPDIDARGLHLYTVMDPQSARTTADPVMLQMIVTELLRSVVTASPPGSRIEVQVQRAGSRCSVRITGVGTPDSDAAAERLRLQPLVEENGGRMVTRAEGGVQTHLIEFPLRALTVAVESAPALVPAADPDRRAHMREVLSESSVAVVEDNEDARLLLTSLLDQLGTRVQAFASGREAAEWFEGHEPSQWPDVLVCDIGLPDEDGYNVVNGIRAREARLGVPLGRRMPAIALTGFARPEDRIQALLAGFQLHLGKPVDPGEFLAALAGLVEEKQLHGGNNVAKTSQRDA